MKWHVSLPKTRRNKVIAFLVVASFVAGAVTGMQRRKNRRQIPFAPSPSPAEP